MIDGEVKNSVLFTSAKIDTGARVIDSVLMPGVIVEAGAVVQRALVAGRSADREKCRSRHPDSRNISNLLQNV